MVSSKHEIAWDIPQKLSSWLLQKTKSLGTSRKSCRHGFLKTRNRLGHPAKVVVMVSSKHEIAWDIPQKLSSWWLQNTKSLGTSRKSCRHGVLKPRNRLGHPAKVVIMVSSNHEIAWGIQQKLSTNKNRKIKTIAKIQSSRGGAHENNRKKTRNRLRHPAKVVVMCPSNTKSPNTSYEKCVQAREGHTTETRNCLRHPTKVVVMLS